MKKQLAGALCLSLLFGTVLTGCSGGGKKSTASLTPDPVLQDLNYSEAKGDIPNPDRGFYQANDGMVVPVSGKGEGTVRVGQEVSEVGGVKVKTRVSHMYFDLKNFSDNAFTDIGTEFDEDYEAPKDVSIKSRGDAEPYDYETNFDYWKENVVPTWPHGKSQLLTDDAISYIKDKLQQVRDGKGTVVVRFSYDGEGYSWVYCDHPEDGEIDTLIQNIEPDKDLILQQMAQIKPILAEYKDVIMSVDGGFFGPWGEMHSTEFGTHPESYVWLLNGLLDMVPEGRSITVQGGAFLSWYNATYGTDYNFSNIDEIPVPEPGTPESRFGFFDDSYAYGTDDPENWVPDDWGSLAEGSYWPDNPLGDETTFDRGKVMTWIRNQNNFFGGEAQGDETPWNSFPYVAWEGSYAQTIYLNSDYSDEVHDRWAEFEYTKENVEQPLENMYKEPHHITDQAIYDPACEGKNGVEYMRDRLGYRLVLRESYLPGCVEKDSDLNFNGKIQNVGFGNIINEKQVQVIIEDEKGNTYSKKTDMDPRQWKADLDSRESNKAAYRDMAFSINMKDFGTDLPTGEYKVYLKINDPLEQSENRRCIRFANAGKGNWNKDLGANLIGTTVLK